jgi:hypothetical protein
MFQVRLTAKIRYIGAAAMPERSAGSAPSVRVIPWHSLYNWGKNHEKKNLSQGSWKVPAGYDSICLHDQLVTNSLDKAIDPGLPSDASGNLGQAAFSVGIYLPSCRGKRWIWGSERNMENLERGVVNHDSSNTMSRSWNDGPRFCALSLMGI